MVKRWNYCSLSSLCEEITSGGAAPQGEKYFSNGKYPFVRVVDMGNLQGKKTMTKTRDMINDEAAAKLRLFPSGTILFTKSGASLLLNQRAILKEPMFVVSHIGCLIPNETVLSEWLYYWMKTVDFNIYAHATTLPSLKLTTIKELIIPVPPLSEQERIVSRIEEMFSQLDAGVETLKKIKAQLAVYRQAVIEDAINSSKKYGISAKPFGEYVSQYQNGISKRSGEGIRTPVLRLADIDKQKITTKTNLRHIGLSEKERARFLLNEGDLLIIRVNGSENNVGRAIVVNTGGTYAVCDHFIRCMVDSTRLVAEYAQLILDSFSSRKFIKENMVSSAGQNTVSQTTMNSIMVYVPEIKVQKEIMNTVNERLSVCDSIEQTVNTALQQAEALRQSILKDAFEGRL